MRSLRILAVAAGAALSAAPALAGDFDGSKTLICAPVRVTECQPDAECTSGTPDTFAAPNFFRLDFGNRQLVGRKANSPFVNLQKAETHLIIQGTEQGYGWSIALRLDDGRMVGSLAGPTHGLTLIGSCTPL